jgi:signal peptidase I
VTLDRALADAHALADNYDGGAVVRVAGDSMLPFFGDGCVLVTKPVAPERLRLGMVVVYRNRFGETVAHRIEGRCEDGWIVRGYNNDRADSTRVEAHNLLGVVYATFFSNGRLQEADHVAALLAATPVALAAPAK